MFNTSFFFNLYEKLFMNDFSDVLINHIKSGKIKFKNKNLVVFDIGAYKGTFSKYMSHNLNLKNKKINFYLFDPLKKLVKFNTKSLKNSKYYEVAFNASKPNYKKFYLNNFLHASGSSLSGQSFKDKKYIISRNIIAFFINPFQKMVKIIKVKTDNINNFCKKNKIKYINVLKIDTEGTEVEVLSGCKKILSKTDIICVEIQTSKKKFPLRIKKIEKILGKRFTLFYKKRIYIASFLTGIVSYDYIYVRSRAIN